MTEKQKKLIEAFLETAVDKNVTVSFLDEGERGRLLGSWCRVYSAGSSHKVEVRIPLIQTDEDFIDFEKCIDDINRLKKEVKDQNEYEKNHPNFNSVMFVLSASIIIFLTLVLTTFVIKIVSFLISLL